MNVPAMLRSLLLRLAQPRVDVPLLVALLLLMGVGLVTLSSAAGESPRTVMAQALRLGAGTNRGGSHGLHRRRHRRRPSGAS